MPKKIIEGNKTALHDFKILETWEAGLKLTGAEVKAVKKGQINLKGSYITLKNNPLEVWLINAHIAKYAPAGYSQSGYDPLRERKLLLNKKEIATIIGKKQQKTLTLIPLLVYTSQRLIKLEIALGQGKKKFDKRESLKKREFDIKKQRLMKK